MANRDIWDVETALKILGHPQAEARLWAEAVEWLLINGPAEIRRILLAASQDATTGQFPNLQPSHYTVDGQAVYKVAELAKVLQISEEQLRQSLARNETREDSQSFPETISTAIH